MTSEKLPSYQLPGSGFAYSGVSVNNILATEVTMAIGLLDESGSTTSFSKAMEECVKMIVRSLRLSPRADNLVYRHAHFGSVFREVHGYNLLQDLNESDYTGCYKSGGATALYDSLNNVFRACKDYGDQLAGARRMANAIVYVITDGEDNQSTLTVNDARKALAEVIASESLESIITILIGVNPDQRIQTNLQKMAQEVGFTQYVPLTDASEKTLAKLANFISHSISSQSQAVGSAGPSQTLNPAQQGLPTNGSLTF